MSSRSSAKRYVSRGSQTDLVPFLCETQPPTPIFAAVDLLPSSFPGDALGPPALDVTSFGPAYTQPQGLLPMKRTQKPSGLGLKYSSLSTASGPASRRIVSLPTISSSPQMLHTSATRQTRVVSMPETCLRRDEVYRKYFHTRQPEYPFSVEDNQTILDEQLWDRLGEKPYPSSLPRTPSPPSSPDSVSTAGDGSHVRHSDGNFQVEDWATWASSPPRPIPALHGPLSLPYARCPSGAEGTVIEGQDLSHKIWGLGIGDTQTNARTKKGASTAYMPENSPLQNLVHRNSNIEFEAASQLMLPPAPQHPHDRDCVIDLSRPSTFHSGTHVHPQSRGNGYEPEPVPLFPGDKSLYSGNHNLDHLHTFNGNIWLSTGGDYASALKPTNARRYQYPEEENAWKGLGIPDLATFDKGKNVSERTPNKLNKGAPVFIPGTSAFSRQGQLPVIDQSLDHASSSRVEGQLYPNSFSNPLSQLWNGDMYMNTLHTPSTVSTQWSPIFALETPDLNASRLNLLTSSRSIPMYEPEVYSPLPENEEYSGKVANLPRSQRNHGPTLTDLTKLYDQDYADQFTRKPPSSQLAFKETTNSTLPGHRPSLSQQRPRSIPLAKLIQRRLSSVPEENLQNKNNQSPTVSARTSSRTLAKQLDTEMTASSNFVADTLSDLNGWYTHPLSKPVLDVAPMKEKVVVKLPRAQLAAQPQTETTRYEKSGTVSPIVHSPKNGKEKAAKAVSREVRYRRFKKGAAPNQKTIT
ncbi:hypothetical protein CPC08DRAFT_813849 [Agrocybe pediades]|nr:hypothetical protein CPC08DRAFT_813849 [Agrocybe pediades]